MICPDCGRSCPESTRFCQACGAALPTPDTSSPETHEPKPHKDRSSILLIVTAVVILAALLASIAVLLFTDSGEAALSVQEPEESDPADPTTDRQITALQSSVFALDTYDYYGSYITSGSGFLAFDSDLLVTNFHVIAGAGDIEVYSQDGDYYWVDSIVYINEEQDLVVLRLDESTGRSPLILGDAAAVGAGDPVYALGISASFEPVLAEGSIRAIPEDDAETNFRFAVSKHCDTSGGPLLNEQGEVIGIISAVSEDGQGENQAIPAEVLQQIDLTKKQMDPYTFSCLYNSYGNSFENYSSLTACTVDYGDQCADSINPAGRIEYTNSDLPEYVDTGLKGNWLSIYRNKLYFLPPDGSSVSVYDLSAEELTENLLLTYPAQAQVKNIRKLFVTDCGLTLIYETGTSVCGLLQLDFDGNVLAQLTDRDYSGTIVVDCLEAAVAVPEANSIRYIPLKSPDAYYETAVDFPIGDRLFYGGGFWLYATNREDSTSIRRLNRYDTSSETITLPGWDQGAFAVSWDVVYYTGNGTHRMDLYEEEPVCLSTAHTLADIVLFAPDVIAGYTAGDDPVWVILFGQDAFMEIEE